MSYTIEEIQIVNVPNTIDMAGIASCVSGSPSGYASNTLVNVTINSIVGSVVTYTPNGAGTFSFNITWNCGMDAAVQNFVGAAVVFQAIVSEQSSIYTFPACCPECNTPVITNDLYAGDLFIPFYLDMPDGTEVNIPILEVLTTVTDGKGIFELGSPLVVGTIIQLQVYETACKALSLPMTVKAQVEDCTDCVQSNPCHIRLINVSVKHTGVNLVSIANLNVESNGDLKYRLDNGEWFSDWSSIGSFSSLVNHTLGIKLINNPACRIEYPFLAISYT